ncbi:MAG: Gliding-associated putative ABC transporter substrate-binding component GldG [Bacteroidetes bacterium 38_7]|nr:MAG: Gliding-associated putative ABC transporter substrate-binding component GldG [Bacteroidetes bacterium 38_7]HAL65455.1 gliding motility-associated ABC transporter substrate-binding protein GldG [Bacteroidales bacterium]
MQAPPKDHISSSSRKKIAHQAILRLVMGVLIIILINIIGSYAFTRFDLTSEKRYTLSESTKKLLKEVDDYIYFRIYLEGDFPAGFKRLRNETREMLDEMRAYNKFLNYEFINPNASNDAKDREKIYRQLIEKGLNPTDLQVKDKEAESRQIIFPGAIASYRGKETPVQLLSNQMGAQPEEILNLSVENLEYNLANTIRKLIVTYKPKVAFIYGHGELDEAYIYDISQSMAEYYTVERIKLDGQINSLTQHKTDSGRISIFNKYKAIIIAKPDSAFSEQDKFIIDQFLMRGGKILWFVDGVKAEMDSLQNKSNTLGLARDINLEDMLFRYGVRINNDLVLDANCLPIMMVTGAIGNQPRFSFVPWIFFPLANPATNHPIVNNLNMVKTQFISSLDTIAIKGVKKTILLSSGQYSRKVNAPIIIDLNIARQEPDLKLFDQPYIPLAVFLEGKFSSLYEHRIPANISNSPEIGFIAESKPTQMLVVSDGDVIRNQLERKNGYPLPLGYDQDTRQTFGNKEFILNALNYMLDDSKLVTIRSREIKMRLLDPQKLQNERLRWQTLNIVAPVVLVLIFGLIKYYLRKRRYAH